MNKYVAKVSRGGLTTLPPLIITCAITGSNQGKESNPNLPETLEEQVQQTYDAYNAGASVVHIHRRDPNNNAIDATRAEDFREINARIRERCPDLIINNSCGGGRTRTQAGTVGPVKNYCVPARPEVATIDISNIPMRSVLRKRPAPLTGRDEDVVREVIVGITHTEAEDCADLMKQYDVKPEFECFDIGDLLYLKDLIRTGHVAGPHLVDLILHPSTNFPTIDYLMTAMRYVPDDSLIGVLAIGPAQMAMLTAAIILGCNVRVGMEDSIYIGKGELAKSNAQFVEKIVRIATELGRPVATPAQARQMMGLGAPRQYGEGAEQRSSADIGQAGDWSVPR